MNEINKNNLAVRNTLYAGRWEHWRYFIMESVGAADVG